MSKGYRGHRAVALALVLLWFLSAGATARAQEPTPQPLKCRCADGSTLPYDPTLIPAGYLLQVELWLASDYRACYEECLRQCGCDPADPDLTCSFNCVVGEEKANKRLERGGQATAALAPLLPCKEPLAFYQGVDWAGYLSGEPALRYSREELVRDLLGGLERFIAEGNEALAGFNPTDVYYVAKTMISGAMPTGREAALQEAARELARRRQQEDPNYRLTPGDLFYLSLKVNGGSVRDALLTCHAALYRDAAGANKKFIEQEGILAPLRNPAGYVDGEWSYRTPQGAARTINPRRALGHDEQGVWYHFFGTAALEYTDIYGAASYYAAWAAIMLDGLPANYTDRVKQQGVPITEVAGKLGDLAIALEENVRTNMGRPPDIGKHCINYAGLAAGNALNRAVGEHQLQRHRLWQQDLRAIGPGDHILRPDGVVIYKSPLSLRIEGAAGEWFAFDQPTGSVDGNTALVYFEPFLEEDGSWGVLAAPFFDVRSVQMVATGDGSVTLGIYDARTGKSSVYEFSVRAGDRLELSDLALAPQHNGNLLSPSYETALARGPEEGIAGLLLGGRPLPGRALGLMLTACCGFLFLLVLVLVVVLVARHIARRGPGDGSG